MTSITYRIVQITSLILLFQTSIILYAQDQKPGYESAISSADQKLEAKDFLSAKSYYELALRFKTDDAYASKKLNETLIHLKKQMEVKEVFYEKIDLADRLLKDQNTEEALNVYKEAQKIIPDNLQLNDNIKKLEETQALEKIKSQDFDRFFTLGKSLLEQNKLEEAHFQLNNALEIFPARKDALEVMAGINAKLIAEQKKNDEFNKIRIDAETAIKRKDYKTAVTKLKEAQNSKPDDPINNKQLIEIQILYDKSEAYNITLGHADESYAQKEYQKARQLYTEAVQLWSDQSYPQDMIQRIDQTIELQNNARKETFQKAILTADQMYIEERYAEALLSYNEALSLTSDDAKALQRVKEITQILALEQADAETNNKYNALISKALQQFNVNDYENSLLSYKEALAVKPNDPDAINRIQEIEKYLTDAATKSTQDKYAAFLAKADNYFKLNQFEDAIREYQSAAMLKPEESYPKSQRAEAEKKWQDLKIQRAADQEYRSVINEADLAFASQQWQEATEKYQEAVSLKPDDAYPQQQLNIVAQAQAKWEDQILAQQLYTENIIKADNLLQREKFVEALDAYQFAASQKPTEAYPQQQIELIKALQTKLAEAEQRKQKIIQLRANAEDALTRKAYDQAIPYLQEWCSLEPANTDALSKFNDIKHKQDSIIAENQRMFDKNTIQAKQSLEAKDYTQAIIYLKNALSLQPNDSWVIETLAQIDNILKEKLLAQKTEYSKWISEADRHCNEKIYDKAVEAYLQAQTLKPDESYPREMIHKITALIELNKMFELNKEPLVLDAGQAKRFSFMPVDVAERRGNIILVKASNTGEQGFPLVISFGSKKGKNGSFVLPIPNHKGYEDYIVRIGSQYKWFSEDNTWIEITVESGTVELGLVQISRGN